MGPLSGLGLRQIRGEYYYAYERGPMAWVPAITTMVTSDQPVEEFAWLDTPPALEEWGGERKSSTLKSRSIKLVPKKYSSTLEFDRDDVQRDKTGQIQRRISELGTKAAELPERILTALLEANGTGYDGAAFFADSHNHGGTVDNLHTVDVTDPDAPTGAEMSTAILQCITRMMQFTDERGEPLNQGARQFALVVPTKFMQPAWAAVRDQFLAASQSNPLLSTDFQVMVYPNPRLNGAAASAGRRFYLCRQDVSLRPLLWAEQDVGDRALQVHGGEGTDMGFWRDGFAVGPKRIAGAALGRFEFALRCELT